MSALVPQEAQIAEVPELPDVAEEKLDEIAEAPKEEPPAEVPVEPTPDPPADPPADVPEREAEDVLVVDDSPRDAPQEQEPDKAIEEILNPKEIVDPEEIVNPGEVVNPEEPKVEPNASDLEKPVVALEPEAPKPDIPSEIANPEEVLNPEEPKVEPNASDLEKPVVALEPEAPKPDIPSEIANPEEVLNPEEPQVEPNASDLEKVVVPLEPEAPKPDTLSEIVNPEEPKVEPNASDLEKVVIPLEPEVPKADILGEVANPEELLSPKEPKVEPNASDLEKVVVPLKPEAPKSDIPSEIVKPEDVLNPQEIVNPEEPLPAPEHQVPETAPEPDDIMVEEPPPTPEPEVSEPATVPEIVVSESLPAEQPVEPVLVYVPTSDFIPPLATPTPQGTPLSRPAPSAPLPPQTLNVYFHGKHRFSRSSHPRLLFKHPREKNPVYSAQYCATSKRIYNEGGETILVYRGLDGARIEGVSISNDQMSHVNSEGKRNFLSALLTRVDSSYVSRDVALSAGAEFCPAGYQWKIFLGLIKKLELEALGKMQIARFRPRKTFRDASRFHVRRKVGRLDIVGGLEEELVDQVVVSFVDVMVEAKAALIKNRKGNKPESSEIPSPVPPSNGESIAGSEQSPSQEQPAGSEPPTSAEAPAN